MSTRGMLPQPGRARDNNSDWPYWISGQVTLAASGGAGLQGAAYPETINVNDHHFRGAKLMVESTGAFLCLITINGRSFNSAPTHSANMFGTAQLPFELNLPMNFPKGTVVQIQFYDFSGAANTLNYSFHGGQYD